MKVRISPAKRNLKRAMKPDNSYGDADPGMKMSRFLQRVHHPLTKQRRTGSSIAFTYPAKSSM
jgi:hypothetical protein